MTSSDFRNPDCVHGWVQGILLGVAIMVVAGLIDVHRNGPPCPHATPTAEAPR